MSELYLENTSSDSDQLTIPKKVKRIKKTTPLFCQENNGSEIGHKTVTDKSKNGPVETRNSA